MKRISLLLIIAIALVACKKEPVVETGDLLVITEYEGIPEENVEVAIYDSYDAWFNYEFLEIQRTDEFGEVLFTELLPGVYYLEAEIKKSSMFSLYKMDSIEVVVNLKKNKKLILEPRK
jgi:hypothetical protein